MKITFIFFDNHGIEVLLLQPDILNGEWNLQLALRWTEFKAKSCALPKKLIKKIK